MLHKQYHEHFAFTFSPCSQENRLACKQQGKKNDDRAATPESERSALERGRTPQEKQDRMENDVAGMTSERRQRILRHVPTALLDQYTMGAAYLTDTLISILGEDQLKRLLKQHPEFRALKIEQTADIETLLSQAFETEGKRSSALLSTMDTRMAMLLTQMLESKIRQFEELKEVALRHMQNDEALTHAVDAQEQKLSLQSRTMDDWLRTASTKELCATLGVPEVADADRAMLLGRIRGYIQNKRKLDQWNLPEIARNEHLRTMLQRTGDLSGVQKQLYDQLRKSLPVVAGVLDAQLNEEAEKTNAWLTEEKQRYGSLLQDITPENQDDREAAFQAQHGVSAIAVAREIEETESTIAFAKSGDTINANDPGTIMNASALVERLSQMRSYPDGTPKTVVDTLRPEQEAAEQWAGAMRSELHELLHKQYASPDQRQQLAQCFGTPDVFATLTTLEADLQVSDHNPRGVNAVEYTQSRRRALEHMVRSLRSNRIAQAMNAHALHEEDRVQASQPDKTVLDVIQETRARLQAATQEIVAIPEIGNGVSGLLNVRQHVMNRAETLEQELRQAELQRQTVTGLGYVRAETRKLERAALLLTDMRRMKHFVLSEEDFERRTGTRNLAAYDLASGDILVNRDRCAREKASIPDLVRHEREHAVQDILTRRAGVFPFLHRAAFEVLRESNPAFGDVLRRHAGEWGIAHQREKIRAQAADPAEAQALEDELLTEELLNRYVDWKRKPQNELIAGERELMAMVENAGLAENLRGIAERDPTATTRADLQDLQMFQTAAGQPTLQDATQALATGTNATTVPAQGGEAADEGGSIDMKGKLHSCQKMIVKLEEFCTAQPYYKGDLDTTIGESKQVYNYLIDIFRSQTVNGQPFPNPEQQPVFIAQVSKLKDGLKDLVDMTQNVDNKLHDLTDEKPGHITGWKAFWGNVAFMSPLDVYLLVQDSIEDVKRMWNRRSKQTRSGVAQGLFGNIPENDLPGLRYLGRLAKENEKREQQAEDEEVDVWKEGLKNKDAYQLMDILSKIQTNKDQAKAIFFLLADKGRIDWGDERIWDLLNGLSQFKMPKEQCKRDIVLRNNWLNKLVKDIWDDSDQFLDWKTSNDSNFNTNRDKFNEYVDTLSQNSGAMRAELERILGTYTACKGRNETPPQDVNPHLYEKLLEFAMVKGKMTMEDKFYYLIRGIAEGLLPLERLNVLNNQVLGSFPFIDYFAGQNNTLAEIKILSERITESGNRFKPGMKTTLFLETELARDESTRQRVTKVITRSGEQIDHEDAPMLMAFLDYGGIEEMLQAFSGQRQRMTKEGLKNSYVGFNTLFKTYARVAELDQDGTARFTSKDATQLGRSLMAYIHFDNIAIQAANDGKGRQSLTWEQVENETMPSGEGRTSSMFRDQMNKLAVDIFRNYGITSVDVGGKAGGANTVTLDQYLGQLRGKRPTGDEEKKALFAATPIFEQRLLKAINGNPSVFARTLQSHGNSLLQERSEDISVDAVRTSLRQ
jgi:hypothetical protein